MEIHKPKPVRAWRDFLSEMSVIVLGILIALSGELLIETLHWRYQVAATRNRVAQELFANVAYATIRVRTAPCVERRLDEVAAIVDEAAKSGKLPVIGDAQTLSNLAVAYQFTTRLGDLNPRELEA